MYSAKDSDKYSKLSAQLIKEDVAKVKDKKVARAWIQQLQQVLNYHDWRYYVLNNAIIDDFKYDGLYKKLVVLEEAFPALRTADSPTQRVARGLTDDFNNVDHLIPMLSLDNSYNAEDLKDFEQRLQKLTEQTELKYCVEPKFDGGSIALIYENDMLVRAATRGNGISGDEITNNAKVIRSIPLRAEFSKYGIYKVELRGEVVIEKSIFKQLNVDRSKENETLIKAGKKPLELYKNARNTASGGLRAKNSEITAKRKMDAFIFQVGVAFNKDGKDMMARELKSHYANIEMLADLGFKVPQEEKLLSASIEEVAKFCQTWEDKRDDYHFEIDGMVVKLDDINLQEEVGATAHHPRWAIAYKFKAKQGKAKLYYVDYQIGRTGAVTPVAKICAIEYYDQIKDKAYTDIDKDTVLGLSLAGVEVKNISLHNEEFIAEKDIRVGDSVLVERAGDVIPYIVGSVAEERTGAEKTIEFPRTCLCDHQSALEKPEGESVWRCVYAACPFQLEESIIHFVSKGAMDIDGLGKDIVKKFMAEGLIQSIPDLYQLDYDAILQLEGWKEKSVNNLKKGIEQSKQQPLWRLLVGLGIRFIGGTTAKLLEKQVTHIFDFKGFTEEQLLAIPDIGPKVAQSVQAYFSDEKNLKNIKLLEDLGLNVSLQANMKNTTNLFEEKTFLFTGTLTTLKRDEAKQLVEENGGKNLGSVSKNLNYLVIGENAGSKLKKAQAISNITIISEQDFLELLQ